MIFKNGEVLKKVNEDGVVTDKDGAHLEDFDSPLNLMFSDFTVFEGDFEAALKKAYEDFYGK